MSVFTVIKHLLFPPKCISCGRHSEDSEEPLCLACRLEYEHEKGCVCRRCGRRYAACTCAPEVRNTAIVRYLTVFHYDRRTHGGKMLLELKKRNNKTVIRFLARELAKRLQIDGKVRKDALLCYVPRDPEKILKYGVDQSKELATALSKEASLPLITALRHRGGNASQKTVTGSNRRKNVENAFAIHTACPPLDGKQLVLVDDILTTGATVAVCADLLRRKGAKEIICITLGKRS